MTPFGLSHVYHIYLSVQYSWEDGVMYDISMKYFHAKWFVFLFQDEPTRVMLYFYRFNIELLEIGLHFNMFYILRPKN